MCYGLQKNNKAVAAPTPDVFALYPNVHAGCSAVASAWELTAVARDMETRRFGSLPFFDRPSTEPPITLPAQLYGCVSISSVMRASKTYVNLNHAWFLNKSPVDDLYVNRPYFEAVAAATASVIASVCGPSGV